MSHVHLISGSNSLRLKGLIYPQKDELDLGLSTGLSGGGEIYVSKKGVPSLKLTRSFAGVRDEDYEELCTWYTDTCEGPRNTFSFTDGDGSTHVVRWLNGPADWQRDAGNRWSGFMRLRVEDFEA
jgi:hypothetical protein